MKLILLSPPDDRPAELDCVQGLFESGLARYHLRKSHWDRERMTAWLCALPAHWRERVWLHSHHELAADFQLGGIHFRDRGGSTPSLPEASSPHRALSRSCHDLPTLKWALGRYDSVFFGPVFPSFSKPGYGPMPSDMLAPLRPMLLQREPGERATDVFALGGVSVACVEPCRGLGFDGVAVLGAVWNTPDPIHSFLEFLNAVERSPTTPSLPLERTR